MYPYIMIVIHMFMGYCAFTPCQHMHISWTLDLSIVKFSVTKNQLMENNFEMVKSISKYITDRNYSSTREISKVFHEVVTYRKKEQTWTKLHKEKWTTNRGTRGRCRLWYNTGTIVLNKCFVTSGGAACWSWSLTSDTYTVDKAGWPVELLVSP